MAKTIRQTVTLKAGPKEVYDALMTSRTHSRITGGKATISGRVGGRFSAFDGYCSGINLELVPGRRIVQAWRASDWPPDHTSTVTFVLERVKGGTRLRFTHGGVPDDQYASLRRGWTEFYWNPMKAFFAAQRT